MLRSSLVFVVALFLNLYAQPPETFIQWQYPPDGLAHPEFGRSVAISGDYAAIGAPNMGAVYLYKKIAPNQWAQIAEVNSTISPVVDFAFKLVLQGDLLVVVSPGTTSIGDHGRVFIFRRITDSQWDLEAELQPADSAPDDRFGKAIDLDGSTIVVGAGYPLNQGAAYVFMETSPGQWSEIQKIQPSSILPDDRFGYAVSVSGNCIAIGAPRDSQVDKAAGSVYIYDYDPVSGIWSYSDQVFPQFNNYLAWFGSAIDMENNRIVIGARSDRSPNPGGQPSGSVYIFQRNGNSWQMANHLIPPHPSTSSRFGASVSISGKRLIIGAPGDHALGEFDGMAYFFVRQNNIWLLQYELAPGDYGFVPAEVALHFGQYAAISGNQMIVGRDMSGNYMPWGANIYEAPLMFFVEINIDNLIEILPPEGGDVEYAVSITNIYESDANFSRTVHLLKPDGEEIILSESEETNLAVDETINEENLLVVEADWPAGEYLLEVHWEEESGSFKQSVAFEKQEEVARASSSPGETQAISSLLSNFPNPFNPSTTLRYQLTSDASVELVIYNTLGEQIVSLVNERQSAGQYTVLWNAENHAGESVASGIYLARIQINNRVETSKLLLSR